VKSVLGTVPVEADGSVLFQLPANTPVSLQPLDKDGKALQLMRSWLVGMPGETLSCVGCHEDQNSAPPLRQALAARRAPSRLEPWRGPERGFSFAREVQPVLDRSCVGCHDGKPAAGRFAVADRIRGPGPHAAKKFSEQGIPDLSNPRTAYFHLHPYVRRNGPEGDYHLLTPLEFHADTSELIQMLRKGHHGVTLDAEAWDRLTTWIDLNAPLHGTWVEAGANKRTLARRLELRKTVAQVDTDAEGIVNPYVKAETFVMPPPERARPDPVRVDGWPFDAAEARRRQGNAPAEKIDLGGGEAIQLVRIPAGAFPLGRVDETPQERPVEKTTIEKPYWMGATEITLAQYRQFDPAYENGVYDMHWKDQVKRGYFMNDPAFPAIRISWNQAMAFCAWLSEKTGRKISLPTEAQWEWACRAGTDTPLSFGGLDNDFSPYANLADAKRVEMAVSGVNPMPIANPDPWMDYELKDPRFHDGVLHLAKAGSFKPNAWGLHDMHGNAAEWTRSLYRPYPCRARDGRDDVSAPGLRALRGGSWSDRPYRSTSSYRLGFPAWQRVYHAGFRIVIED
jgi:formylglycine-generating enzyme required for sulfatase activity